MVKPYKHLTSHKDSKYFSYFADYNGAKAVRSDFVGDKGLIPGCTTCWCEFCGKPYESRTYKTYWLTKEDTDVCADVCSQCLFILSLKNTIDIQHEKNTFTYTGLDGVHSDG